MTYIINVYIDDDPVQHPDMESALREIEQRPTEISEALERTETGVIVWSAEELAGEIKWQQREIASDNRHNQSLAAAE